MWWSETMKENFFFFLKNFKFQNLKFVHTAPIRPTDGFARHTGFPWWRLSSGYWSADNTARRRKSLLFPVLPETERVSMTTTDRWGTDRWGMSKRSEGRFGLASDNLQENSEIIGQILLVSFFRDCFWGSWSFQSAFSFRIFERIIIRSNHCYDGKHEEWRLGELPTK